MLVYSDQDVERFKAMVGKKVYKKRSGKPFKSGLVINTVKAADTIHPVTGRLCFTFLEDESYVECHICAEAVPTPVFKGLELWDGDPNCEHIEIDAPGGGAKCIKCPAWFCF